MVKFSSKTTYRHTTVQSTSGQPRRNHQLREDDLEAQLAPAGVDRKSTDHPIKARSTHSINGPASISPSIQRRTNRSSAGRAFRTVDAVHLRPDWQPGQEPGLDPSKLNGGRDQSPILHEECRIAVVEYSEDDITLREFGNAEFIDFLKEPQEEWVKCRWINVNGLSWDVVQALANHKNFHKLAIEDLINTNNRTKADWYPEHTYLVMTLQKLVHLDDDGQIDEEVEVGEGVASEPKGPGRSSSFMQTLFPISKSKRPDTLRTVHDATHGFVCSHTEGVDSRSSRKLRTLQRYHGGPNQERMAYMEQHSALTKRKLAVSAEQVSIFLTADNTVIAFFQNSADDLEVPILRRLSSPDTVLRQSCDASMLVQALIDGIIDLAIPIATAYQDIIGELELDVLTEPSISHASNLYILTSEMTKIRGFVSPVSNLITALRDHKSVATASHSSSSGDLRITAGVTISPMAQTYFGDIEDHIILITDALDNMRRSCDNMIDLIFNTISAYQNESMKQLTVVTIIFLPLSFMTGYFGMNLTDFPSIDNKESYFWIVAAPVGVVVILFLMRDTLKWYFTRLVQKRGISRNRKGRLLREKNM